MRQPSRVQRGDIGERAAEVFFLELQWGPLPTGVQDLGTDLFIQLRDESGVDLRLMLGAQVKTGDSWFDSPGTLDGKPGWWYKEPDKSHAEYWANHHVPHILVLQSEDRRRRVWAVLSKDTIVDTGAGFKVFVPAEQRLDPSWRETWVRYASESRVAPPLEGSRWNFSINELPRDEWARFALLAPRLVAPHPNKGYGTAINWAEATAICLQAESERWDGFAANLSAVPSSEDAQSADEAGWRFAAAVRQWIDEGSIELLEAFDAEANVALRVAKNVCLSVAYFDRQEFALAATTIDAEITDELSVDHVWLAVHRSRILAETGNADAALEQLAKANVEVASVAGDVTVSALRSSILWSLYELSDRESLDLSAVAPGMDTTTSWWRTQSVASGLESWTTRVFRGWGRDRAKRFGGSNAAHNELFSAALIARLAGDSSGYRSATTYMAMVDLAVPAEVNPPVSASLDSLRECGSEEELKLAIGRIKDEGPLADLRRSVAAITPQTITHTSWRADLVALSEAGGFYPPESAGPLITFLLTVLNDPKPFEDSYAVHVSVNGLLQAIAGLSPHLEEQDSERVVRYALGLDANASQIQENSLAALLRTLDQSVLERHESEFRLKADDASLPAWLRTIHAEYVTTSRDTIRPLLLNGDVRALSAVREFTNLNADEAQAMLKVATESLLGLRYGATGFGIGGPDMAQLALQIGVFCSLPAGIQTAISFVADPDALRTPKRNACKWLARQPDLIDEQWRATLRECLPGVIAESRSDPLASWLDEFGGAAHLLLLALLPEDDGARAELEAELVTGDEQMRFDACDYFARISGSEPLLLALARDSNYRVSHRAILALSHLVANSPSPQPAYLRALASFATADGEANALFILGGLESSPLSRPVRDIVQSLTEHQSAEVRSRAAKTLHDAKAIT
ncbi:DUF4365 domain-containing protein [Leifsonia sp. NCR5]|uniref:DUF4365 domain-containing protein n=1 Tax=Leifsonia sp. NCR5 TaxID=1978342 RepID=UPI00211A120E|nr:DUF4365 domain-containing protein [Leifsonia sp. NCR5]